tara:strand:+ start:302 stop:685 length:384 start_codon:yes stop_codon:yes gene_type:complete
MHDKHNLFVYGTLKEGGRLHDYLKGQPFLGTYYTEPNYFMFDAGPIPMVFPVPKGTGQKVEGEIYEVNDSEFRTIKTMEEGAGYDTKQDIFLSKGGMIHRLASIFIYPPKYLYHQGEIKKGFVSWKV